MNELYRSYQLAQQALVNLKTAVFMLLQDGASLTDAQIGRALGIYHGHRGKHVGHIPRALLEMMQTEGLLEQDSKTKQWKLKQHI